MRIDTYDSPYAYNYDPLYSNKSFGIAVNECEWRNIPDSYEYTAGYGTKADRLLAHYGLILDEDYV